jgi:hypothetical protein
LHQKLPCISNGFLLLQIVTCNQTATMNTFFQSKDGKLFPVTRRCYTLPANIVGKTYPTGWRGTGRAFIAETGGKRRAGKPFAAARLRGDLIVAYVRQLQRDRPGPRGTFSGQIIMDAAARFKTDTATMWRALRRDRKLGPYEPMPLGPVRLRITHTITHR